MIAVAVTEVTIGSIHEEVIEETNEMDTAVIIDMIIAGDIEATIDMIEKAIRVIIDMTIEKERVRIGTEREGIAVPRVIGAIVTDHALLPSGVRTRGGRGPRVVTTGTRERPYFPHCHRSFC